MKTKHSIIIRLVNNPGCIIRIALVLERRGYSILSLQMKTATDGYTDMQMEVLGDISKFEQIQSQLRKLIDVISVQEICLEKRSSGWTNNFTKALTRSFING